MEVVIASAISAILLMSLRGVVMLSASAVPRMNERARTREDVAAFISDLRLELQAAERIENVEANVLQFTIPDRDANGQPESILYLFNSGAESGVLRSTGVWDLVAVLPATRVRFAAERSVRTERVPGESIEDSAPSVLAGFDAGSWTAASNPISLQLTPIDQTRWAAQMLEPLAPADAVAWRPTQVGFPMSNRNAGGDTIQMELRRSLGLQPSASGGSLRTRHESFFMNNSTSKSWSMFDIDEPGDGDGLQARLLVPRGESLAMVLGSSRDPGTADPALVCWAAPGDLVAPPVHGRAFSDDAGETWARYGEQALEYELKGTWVRRSSDVLTLDHVFLKAVHVFVEVDGQTVHAGRIDLPARPRLDRGRWDLEVAGENLTVPADWMMSLGGGQISLEAAPNDRLLTPVVATFDFDSDEDGAKATLDLRADRTAGLGKHLPVRVRYEQVSAAERRVEVLTADTTGQWQVVSWWTEADPEAVLSGRLVIFPAEALVAVELVGEYRGTFELQRPDWNATRSIALSFGSTRPSLMRLSVVRPEPLP